MARNSPNLKKLRARSVLMDLEGCVGILGTRKLIFCGVEEILRFWKGSKRYLEDLEGLGGVLWIWKDLEVSADL